MEEAVTTSAANEYRARGWGGYGGDVSGFTRENNWRVELVDESANGSDRCRGVRRVENVSKLADSAGVSDSDEVIVDALKCDRGAAAQIGEKRPA